MRTNTMKKAGYAAAGLVAGVALATTVAAQAATSPTPSATSSSTASADPHPGDNGADGVPEANEVHGGPGGHDGGGGGLSLSGTVTAVGSSTVTIRTSKGTTAYAVTSTSDIDKNGEASLASLKPGDVVRFSVVSSNATQIDKLHAGDESKDRPAGAPQGPAAPSPTQG